MKIQYQNDHLVIFESALYRTTTTLIFDKNSILLVDPNWLPIEIEFIADWIEFNTNVQSKYLLFTHSDYDHIIGYGRFKNFKTIASKAFTQSQTASEILKQINDFDDENYITRNYPIRYPVIDLIISGDSITRTLGIDEYDFYQAPGHNRDGIISHNRSKGILIVGDYLSNIEFPYIYESISMYQETLEKLETIINTNDIRVLISGHGDYTSVTTEMNQRISDARAYIDQLQHAVKNNLPFPIEQLFDKYSFPRIMTKFHEANVSLAKKEMKA